MESKNRTSTMWIVVGAVLVVSCLCLVLVAAVAAGWLLGLPVGWQGVTGAVEEQLEQTFAVGESPRLQIENYAGKVTVHAGERGEIHVVATKHALWARDVDRIEVELLERNGGLAIKTSKPVSLQSTWVRLEITAPADTDLDLHTGSGSVEVNGLKGGARVGTGSGSVVVRNLDGDLDIQTGSGSVKAYDLTGRVKVHTGSGSVLIEGMTGDIDAHSGTGGMDVRGAAGAVRLDTGSGSIKYQGSPQGEGRFETGTGSINLRLPANLNAKVDLHTGSGSIDVGYAVDGQISRRDVKGVIGRGDEVTIYARTGSGSIDLIQR